MDREPFTIQDFYDENPIHILLRRIDAGAFGHGLAGKFSPNVAALLRA